MFAPASEKQLKFLTSDLDKEDGTPGATITVFGGAAGSGKSYCAILDMLKWVHLKQFRGVIFRRTTPQLRGAGGMWDTAQEVFRSSDRRLQVSEQKNKMSFKTGSEVLFKHMEHEKSKLDIQGWQISEAIVDEATQFTETMIMYIISRLRTDAPMRSHIKLTCNPDADSYLRVWLDKAGYLDKEGYPDKDRCGKLVYCGQISGEMVFEQSLETWKKKYPKSNPLTFTFISATCMDNPPLLAAEPDYLTKLQNLPRIEKARLLDGNWYVREQGAGYFKREWVGQPISAYQVPRNCRTVRAWDMACTLPSEAYVDPDFTVGIKACKDAEGTLYILDMVRLRERAAKVNEKVINTALSDGDNVNVVIPQDPGAAGKVASDHLASQIFSEGITCRKSKTEKSKLKRFEPFAAMAENGMVKVVKGDWNEMFFQELEAFGGSQKVHDDIVDAVADACRELCSRRALPAFALPTAMTKENPFSF